MSFVGLAVLASTACDVADTGPADGTFASSDFVDVMRKSVADNGLVGSGIQDAGAIPDILATGVLHRTGFAPSATPTEKYLQEICRTYGTRVPAAQFMNELRYAISVESFNTHADKASCVSSEAPSWDRTRMDAQQFLYSVAVYGLYNQDSSESVNQDDLDDARIQFLQTAESTYWNYWLCIASEPDNVKYSSCGGIQPRTPPPTPSDLDSLMEVRAAAELDHIKLPAGPTSLDSALYERALSLPVEDALEAAQLERIASLTQRSSPGLESWATRHKHVVNKQGLIDVPTRTIGTLENTYLAARMLEDQVSAIVNDDTRSSMHESVKLASAVSRYDHTTATLMRAYVLEQLGELSPVDKDHALEQFQALQAESCPSHHAYSCALAGDAAKQLDPTISVPKISPPNDVSRTPQFRALLYHMTTYSWAYSNPQEWVDVARSAGLDPQDDITQARLDPSTRMWAAAARNAFDHERDSGEEKSALDAVQPFLGCQGSSRVATRTPTSEACSLDSTMAYYLSGLWENK